MRIGFLYNHDQIHQIAHSLPIALALANACSKPSCDTEIIVAVTAGRIATEVVRQIGPNQPSALSLVTLTLKSAATRLLDTLFSKVAPISKLLIYRENLAFFKSLDALVVTERTSLILKSRYALTTPMMILADHGAGDRAIGFGKSIAQFDHILAAGPKIKERMVAEAGVEPDRITITGYSKFDAKAPRNSKAELFPDNNRPVILYNPHLSPHLSSWYKQGRDVLDYFLEHPEYNLIFAPHMMLFQRKIVFSIDKFRFDLPGKLDPKYAAAHNIHVDLGSVSSTDMTYTDAADIYLGDASSQVYEFLKTPRPCIFLNSHGLAFEGDPNFAHWQAGEVVTSIEELDGALSRARAKHEAEFLPIQRRLFAHTFDLNAEPSASRAAHVIEALLDMPERVSFGSRPSASA